LSLEPITVALSAAVGPFAVIEQMATVELDPTAVLSVAAVGPFAGIE